MKVGFDCAWLVVCIFFGCTGSLNDDNRKLEWTVEALAMEDPFEREHEVPEDISKCLRC